MTPRSALIECRDALRRVLAGNGTGFTYIWEECEPQLRAALALADAALAAEQQAEPVAWLLESDGRLIECVTDAKVLENRKVSFPYATVRPLFARAEAAEAALADARAVLDVAADDLDVIEGEGRT